MLEQYFRSARVHERIHDNILHDEIKRLIEHLNRRGHPIRTVQRYVQAAEHFGRWLHHRRHRISISSEAIDRFLKQHLPNCRCPVPAARHLYSTRSALKHLLRALGKEVNVNPRIARSRIAQIIDDYDEHLSATCGLAGETRHYRKRYALELLEDRFPRGNLRLRSLTVKNVVDFVCKYTAEQKRSSAQVAACSIRSFLRFLQMQDLCSESLVRAVPRIPQWKLSSVPRTLSQNQQRRFLTAFNRSTSNGCRDYAMALCMVQLGLRVSEVVELRLDDIKWREGLIEVRSTKERRVRQVPLTASIGKAIACYLRDGRPISRNPKLFLRKTVPIGTAVTKTLVRYVIRCAFARCGLPANWTGTHILRHTAATRLYERGAALKEIADLLGHRSLDTSTIYTKVNISQLGTVALPWPEVRR